MESLTLMKELLGVPVEDTSKDNILNHYLNRSRQIILAYCNVSEIPLKYNEVIVEFAIYLYKNRNNIGMTNKREGERSANFEVGIPENIRLALPLPKIKVGGY